jgi:hypothetical protein
MALSMSITQTARGASNFCSPSNLSEPFLPWVDPAYYGLVPGGDFENGTWTFGGGAQRVPGSEPYAATGQPGKWSLSLPAGSSAQSPAVCVVPTDPTVRFFIAGSGGVEVDFIYSGTTIASGEVFSGGGWTPTPIVLTGSAITAPLDGSAEVSLKFVALSGNPVLDDVFVDPWNRG